MRSLIGDRAFYRRLLAVMTPVLIQNIITNFVSLLDNIMVGQIGTEPMSGVAIANQLQFLLQMFAGGIASGISVISAQYWGQRRTEPIKRITAVGMVIGLIGSGAIEAKSGVVPLSSSPLPPLPLPRGCSAFSQTPRRSSPRAQNT